MTTRSFINVFENSVPEIHDSVIADWFLLELGGFLRAIYRNAIVEVYDSLIHNNAVIEGGVSFLPIYQQVFRVQTVIWTIYEVYKGQILF